MCIIYSAWTVTAMMGTTLFLWRKNKIFFFIMNYKKSTFFPINGKAMLNSYLSVIIHNILQYKST